MSPPPSSSERPVTIITGAGSGIGLACVRPLADAGHRLALVGRRIEPLREAGDAIGEEGEDWVALPTDVSVPEQAMGLVPRVIEGLGRLDAVVNNAGWTPMTPVAEHTPEVVDKIFAVNTVGPTLIVIEAVKAMADGAGRIVNVSSMASDDPFPGLTVYGGAKAALNTLTKGLANELGPESLIKVFSVAPGAVETPLLRSILSTEQLPSEACLTPDEVAAVIVDCVLGKRDGETGQTIWMPNR